MNRLACAAALLCATIAPKIHAQWTIQDSHTTADLRGIHALGNGIAWASGTEGTVLRTTNDGKDWQRCTTPPDAAHLDFRGIQAFDASTAIVMSSGKGPLSRLYKTTDACRTWTLVFTNPDPEGFWDAVQFFRQKSFDWDPNTEKLKPAPAVYFGTLIGDPVDGNFSIFQTVNGDIWTRRTPTERRPHGEGCKLDAFESRRGEAVFAASNQSLLTFGQNRFLFVTGGLLTRFAYTDHFDLDGALCHDSASFMDLPMAHGTESSGAFAVLAKDPNAFFPLTLMIVGGDYAHPENATGTSVYISSRDGLHIPFTSYFDVITPETPPHGYRSAVAYDPTTQTWITVGPNGTDISTDDGRNWRPLRPSPAPDGKPTSPDGIPEDQHWNALSLPIVVGPHGRIGKLNPQALSAN
jgi:hypothetical protein